MTQEALENPRQAGQDGGDGTNDSLEPAGVADGELGGAKVVPVTEAIRYRRRAQRAESGLQQVEQKLTDVQSQLEQRLEQLARAEAQRDEFQHRLESAQSRAAAEKLLLSSGVADLEVAVLLLEKRVDLSGDPDQAQLRQAVEQLLVDKPYLLAEPPRLPGKTASARLAPAGGPGGRAAA